MSSRGSGSSSLRICQIHIHDSTCSVQWRALCTHLSDRSTVVHIPQSRACVGGHSVTVDWRGLWPHSQRPFGSEN
eukprot:g66955.t1